MDNDIYTAPQAELATETANNTILASRWKRLWASMLDSIILLAFTIPAMYFSGGFTGITAGKEPSIEYNLMIGALALIVFFLINFQLLAKNGQTIGKKILDIKIVDLNGDLPTMKKHFFKRYAVFFLPGQIPVVGQIISIINVLFIFGRQKRCGHDFIAGTKVVVC